MATSGYRNVTVTSWDTLRFSWEEQSQSVANNTTTITWKLQLIATSDGYISSSASKAWSVTVNGTKYSGANTVGISNNTTRTLASGTTTIAHASDGSKTFSYSFSQQFDIDFDGWIGTVSGSGTGTLDTIPRKSSLSASNGTLGTAQTLTVTRASSSFTHTITYKCGSASGTVATKSSSTSISWTPPLSLSSQKTNGTTVSIIFTITTYSGDSSVGSNTKSITCAIPASVKPSCSITLEDTAGWQDTYGQPVQGLSSLKITVSPTLAYGSPIASYSISANGAKYTTATATTTVLKTAGSSQITATVKDKRGRSGTASTSVNVLAYAFPKISRLTVHRCDQDGTENDQGDYIRAIFSASITSLNSKNTAAYTLRYKKTTETSQTEVIFTELAGAYTVGDKAYIFAADSNSSYEVEIEAKDRHGTVTRTTNASTAFTLMNWGSDGTSMGIGKVAEKADTLQVGLKLEVMEPAKLVGAERVSIPIADGFKLYGSDDYNQPTVYKNAAGMVELVGRLSPATINADIGATTGALMFTLPAGYRPMVSFTAVMQGSSSAIWLMTVETNGQVKASRYRKGELYETPDAAAWLPFHVVYMAN